MVIIHDDELKAYQGILFSTRLKFLNLLPNIIYSCLIDIVKMIIRRYSKVNLNQYPMYGVVDPKVAPFRTCNIGPNIATLKQKVLFQFVNKGLKLIDIFSNVKTIDECMVYLNREGKQKVIALLEIFSPRYSGYRIVLI